MSINDFRLSRHFNLMEFQCNCCERIKIDVSVIEKVQAMRVIFDRPIIITSGYRCHKHNADVKGHVNSQHIYGMAVDITCKIPTELNIRKLKDIALLVGFSKTYTDLKKMFVHCGL